MIGIIHLAGTDKILLAKNRMRNSFYSLIALARAGRTVAISSALQDHDAVGLRICNKEEMLGGVIGGAIFLFMLALLVCALFFAAPQVNGQAMPVLALINRKIAPPITPPRPTVLLVALFSCSCWRCWSAPYSLPHRR